MNNHRTLEFDTILDKLAEHAHTEAAKKKCLSLGPYLSQKEANQNLNETTQAKQMMERTGTPPLESMPDLSKLLLQVEGGEEMLLPEQIWRFYTLLTVCGHMKQYLKRAESTGNEIAQYGSSIIDLSELRSEIDRCIWNNEIYDKASTELYSIRRKMENVSEQIKVKLNTILSKNKAWFSDFFTVVRNGHYTLPVKREFKNTVPGAVIETSNSGGTCFIEPSAVAALQKDFAALAVDEDNEIRRILYTFTAQISNSAPEIRHDIEVMERLDFLFAKAKLSYDLKASPVSLTVERRIHIKNAWHPLLKMDTVVPLNFELGEDTRGIVITGPNTGGKTVALKTVGLLSLMAQSGLHVPADGESVFSLCNQVLCDIGDGQSISENLSTFSAHMKNIIEILHKTTKESLVLLDELGSGTDPNEGMGLAIAILEELCQRNCLFVATTHYPEVKGFVSGRQGIQNARMAFDRQSLLPLYRLEIGEAGDSCALYIAQRLGMPEHILINAQKAAYATADHGKTGAMDSGKFVQALPGQCVQESPSIVADVAPKPVPARALRFAIGDTVMVYPQRQIGIVYAMANGRGEIGVQIYRNKKWIPYKKVKLQKPATEAYPEHYDFSLVFEEVRDTKVERLIEKHKRMAEGKTE